MSRRKCFILFLALFLILAAFRFQFSEPSYQGKTLSIWLEELNSANVANDDYSFDTQILPAIAVRQMGGKALPSLMNRLQAQDSPLNLYLQKMIGKQTLFRIRFLNAREKQMRGAVGLRVLGPLAKPAEADLLKMLNTSSGENLCRVTWVLSGISKDAFPLLTHPNSEARTCAILALKSSYVNQEAAIPLLIKSLKDSSPNVQANSALVLGEYKKEPDKVIPALIETLKSKDTLVCGAAARALGKFGTQARPAISLLLQLIQSTNENIPDYALEALIKIDPALAAKQGIR